MTIIVGDDDSAGDAVGAGVDAVVALAVQLLLMLPFGYREPRVTHIMRNI